MTHQPDTADTTSYIPLTDERLVAAAAAACRRDADFSPDNVRRHLRRLAPLMRDSWLPVHIDAVARHHNYAEATPLGVLHSLLREAEAEHRTITEQLDQLQQRAAQLAIRRAEYTAAIEALQP